MTAISHILRYFLSLLALLLFFYTLNAQPIKKFSSQSYTVTEGLLKGLVLDMAEDGNGFLWVSTGAGLQRFDGINFETIYPQQGLPQTNHITFFKLSNGDLWLRFENGISSYNSAANKFQLIFTNTNEKITSSASSYSFVSPFVPFAETKNEVWCWKSSEKKFVSVNKLSGKITDSLNVAPKLQPTSYRFKKGNDNSVYYDAYEGDIVQIDFISSEIRNIYHRDKNSIIKNYAILNYTPLSNNNLLLTTDKAIYKANIVTGATTLLSPYPKLGSDNIISTSLTYLQDSLFALSLNNELFILNTVNGKILYRMVDEQNEPFVAKGYINKCITDRYNHMWLLTEEKGLEKINFNSLSIKYYGEGKLQENFTRCIYPDKKSNLIITGSLFNGFFVFDTLQNLRKHFKLKFGEQTSSILKIEPFKYLLFTNGDPGVYLLNRKGLELKNLDKKITNSFIPHEVANFTHVQPLTDTTAALFCNHSLYIIHYSAGNIKFIRIPIQNNYSGAFIDHKKQLWLAESKKYSISTGNNFEYQKFFYLPEKIITKCFFEDNKNNIWIGTEKGLYKLNGETYAIMRIYTKKDGLANDSIYSIINDDQGNIWCGTNKGISCIYNNNKIFNLYVTDGLQSEEFNTNSCAKAADGELFFGGINGVNSFFPGKMKDLDKEPKILVTNIKVMDTQWVSNTALWNLQQITLPYTQNVLSFYFSALSRFSPDVYNYKYKMNGIDKEWINAGSRGYARYILPPGKYIFKYTAAGNLLGRELQPKFITITITPPFWRTMWFIILITVCAIATVIAVVKFYYQRKHQKKLRHLEIQQTLQHERERISRDLHDNIGAYTTVLIASAEQLTSKTLQTSIQQSAQKVSENARNIMSSLKETIWVLNNDIITITDFADRFKLYAKKMLQNFANVQIMFQEQLDSDSILTPSEALNIFRVMQEALQNAIKHANPHHINILICSNATIRIAVKDDGKGFDIKKITSGNGLSNMQHRAKESGYELTISTNGKGTEVSLKKINSSKKLLESLALSKSLKK